MNEVPQTHLQGNFSETDATLICSRVSSHSEQFHVGIMYALFVGTLQAMKIEKARCQTISFAGSSV